MPNKTTREESAVRILADRPETRRDSSLKLRYPGLGFCRAQVPSTDPNRATLSGLGLPTSAGNHESVGVLLSLLSA